MVYEFNQLFVADSFQALYRDSHGRSTLSRDELNARQELCEDLAQSLAAHCLSLQLHDDEAQTDVLTQLHTGLLNPPSSLPAGETYWVTVRTAELLQWDVPVFLRQSSSSDDHG